VLTFFLLKELNIRAENKKALENLVFIALSSQILPEMARSCFK
jgi:hypothetical protein